MSTKFIIKLVAEHCSTGTAPLVTTIPRRMLRTQSMDAIKQHVALQLNLHHEHIAGIEPFYS